jgi:hypothetical protein
MFGAVTTRVSSVCTVIGRLTILAVARSRTPSCVLHVALNLGTVFV